ncbi:MAG: hypothetical protein ACX93I_10045 [Winogradskyella sp.]
MINQLKNIINETQKFYVLSVSLSATKDTYYVLEVLYKDKAITILNKFNLSELNQTSIKQLKKGYPIILHIDGDSVISKDVTNNVGYRNNLIFKSNPEEFYFYEYHQDNKVFASLTRKEIVDDILNKLNEADKYVVHVTLGPFVLINLLLVLKNENTLVSNDYSIQIEDSYIQSYEKSGETNLDYIIGDESISERETTLIASVIEYLYPSQNIKTDSDYLNFNKEQQKYKKYFKVYGTAVLITILVALFVSHFILKSNVVELAEKESLISISNQTLKQINDLKEERGLKEKILLSSSIIDKNYSAKYLSDLGKSVPLAISLDFIKLKKPLKKIKPNEKVIYSLNTIEVSGYTTSDSIFNSWIKSLKEIVWIKQIEILKYNEDSKSNNSFLISLEI